MPAGARPNPPAHVAHFSVEGVVDDAYPWACGFWVRNGNEDSPTVNNLTDVAEDIGDLFKANFARVSSSRLDYLVCRAIYYGPTGGELGVDSPMSGSGTGSASVLPANVAMCISWKVGPRYRGGHPRTYLAGIDADTQEDATSFIGTEVATAQADANDFLAGVNAINRGDFTDAHLGTVSFVLDNEWRTPPIFRDYVPDATTVDTRIDSMRRRLGRDR